MPSLGIDGFTDTAQHSERAEVVGVDVVLTETTEEPDGGGSRVELGDLVLLDRLPVTRWSGVNRGGFEDSGGDTVEKGSVDDVTNRTCEIGGCAGLI